MNIQKRFLFILVILLPIIGSAQIFNTDVIVKGSICVGTGCINTESFGFDTQRWKEDNIRLHFQDESIASGFPSNDWRIVINDTENGGDAQVEIWLDLRDTAILPQAALEHMNENQWITDDDTTSSSMIDRVLISGSDVAQVVKQMSREDGETVPEIIYVDNQDKTIRSVEDASHILGGVVSLRDDEFTDPLPALDIMSKGGWVVIDSEEIVDENKREQAIGGLVDFLAAGASSSASSSSLLLGADKSDQGGDTEEGVEAGNKGGIALSCTNKSDVLRAGSYSQSAASSGSLTTTDGGILIQSSADDVASSLKIAVAVPFDAMLWKAAAVVFQSGDDE